MASFNGNATLSASFVLDLEAATGCELGYPIVDIREKLEAAGSREVWEDFNARFVSKCLLF